MNVTQFFEKYGDRVVKMQHDDTETGDFRLMPEESLRAYDAAYLYGHEVFSIFETDDPEVEEVRHGFEAPSHPYLTGYFVVEKINLAD